MRRRRSDSKPLIVGSTITSGRKKTLIRTVMEVRAGDNDNWSFIVWEDTEGRSGMCREDYFRRWAKT